MGQTVARTDSVRLKLSPDMLSRLEKYAQNYGMPLSTLGAFALAEWVNRQDQTASMVRMGVLEAMRSGVAQAFDQGSLERAMAAALPACMVALADAGYTDTAEGLGGSALPAVPDGAQAGSGSSAAPEAAAIAGDTAQAGALAIDRARSTT